MLHQLSPECEATPNRRQASHPEQSTCQSSRRARRQRAMHDWHGVHSFTPQCELVYSCCLSAGTPSSLWSTPAWNKRTVPFEGADLTRVSYEATRLQTTLRRHNGARTARAVQSCLQLRSGADLAKVRIQSYISRRKAVLAELKLFAGSRSPGCYARSVAFLYRLVPQRRDQRFMLSG